MPLALARRSRSAALAVLMVAWLGAWIGACGGSPSAGPSVPKVVVGTGAGAAQAAGEAAAEDDAQIPIFANDPVRGRRLAYVTVVVFSDFQCPFCGRLATTLGRVQETYGDDVRIVFKHDPLSFHPHARLAAEVGAGVLALKGPEAFWRYHDMAFRSQQPFAPDVVRDWAIAAFNNNQPF